MADERRREGPGADRSWAAALDPAANLRALGDVQRRGLQAAGALVERLVAAVDGDGDARSEPGDEEAPASDLEGVVDLWADLVKRSLRAITSLPEFGAEEDGVSSTTTVDIGRPSGAAPLRVTVDAGGATGEDRAELWLHNGTGEDRGTLSLHHGELRGSDGTPLAARLLFEPPELDVLPARSSRGVVVTVELVDPAAVAGSYRGVVLVSGLPDAWLPVEVVVSP